jgi:nucleoside-triphosphatase THEP1
MSGNCWMRVAGSRALEDGADIVIINRFGRQEREGKGLAYLIERALSADIPVVIAVPVHRFADWIRFAGGMSVKLRCDRDALDAWWNSVSGRAGASVTQRHRSVCEVFK